MTSALESVVDHGGEGVVLRKPKSFYEQGRSTSLFKIKVGMRVRVSLMRVRLRRYELEKGVE